MTKNSQENTKQKKIRIASGSGFWGDWLEAPVNQVKGGDIDYLVLDYLAEVTMSILAKQKERNPDHGYAKDFVDLIERIANDVKSKNIKIITNAGGMNPQACAKKITSFNKDLKVAIVEGDNILAKVNELSKKHSLNHLESKNSFEKIAENIRSANVYLGYEPIVEALESDADIVICGRVSDPSMVLAPLMHEFAWEADDWDKLASGTLAGHLIECGAQVTGGNCSYEWQNIENLAEIGFPIAEVFEDASFVITKHKNTGGKVSLASVKEQMVYEIGDPKAYITPDVCADFTTAKLEQITDNQVKVSNVSGKAKTDFLKISISYHHGYRAVGTLVYSWPEAFEKAKIASKIIDKRISTLGLSFEKTHSEIVGANACHGALASQDNSELAEVTFRYAVQGKSKEDVKRFTREVAPLILSGPPFATAYAGGKGNVTDVFGYWPTLIDRKKINTTVSVVG